MIPKIIPGPKGEPLLGSLRAFVPNPAEFLLRAALEYGDIVKFRVLHFDFYLVVKPEYTQEVLVTQHDKLIKSPRDVAILSKFLGRGILVTDGAYHKRQRKLVQPAMHTTRIQNYATTMVDYTQRIIEAWADGSEQHVDQAMRQLTMEIVAKSLFDADFSGQGRQIGEAIDTLQHIAGQDFRIQNIIPDWLPLRRNRRRAAAGDALDRLIRQVISERRASGEDKGDLLSMLLLSEDETGARMTDQEARDEAVTLFAAGHETTSNAMSWTWYLLSQHPEIEARLQAEVDSVLGDRKATFQDLPNLRYTAMIVKESLRLYPPAWVLNAREALADIEIDGYTIPKGGSIFVAPYAVHRNPVYFADPLRFDPERFSPENEKRIPRYAYFPFGGGPHVCIGNSFALMEAQLILATMAQRVSLSLLPDQTIDIDPLVTMGPKHGLRMRVRARENVGEPTVSGKP
jgi:cytochrome P450